MKDYMSESIFELMLCSFKSTFILISPAYERDKRNIFWENLSTGEVTFLMLSESKVAEVYLGALFTLVNTSLCPQRGIICGFAHPSPPLGGPDLFNL